MPSQIFQMNVVFLFCCTVNTFRSRTFIEIVVGYNDMLGLFANTNLQKYHIYLLNFHQFSLNPVKKGINAKSIIYRVVHHQKVLKAAKAFGVVQNLNAQKLMNCAIE